MTTPDPSGIVRHVAGRRGRLQGCRPATTPEPFAESGCIVDNWIFSGARKMAIRLVWDQETLGSTPRHPTINLLGFGMVTDQRREYLRAYQRRWIEERRTNWIHEHGPCIDCGTWYSLEVDHVDPAAKELHASALWSLAIDNPRRVSELSKCVVRCEDCHKKKTRKERSLPLRHGTSTAYKRGCRCQLCRDEVACQKRAWRTRTGKR